MVAENQLVLVLNACELRRGRPGAFRRAPPRLFGHGVGQQLLPGWRSGYGHKFFPEVHQLQVKTAASGRTGVGANAEALVADVGSGSVQTMLTRKRFFRCFS